MSGKNKKVQLKIYFSSKWEVFALHPTAGGVLRTGD
jgi:hypothetical protein